MYMYNIYTYTCMYMHMYIVYTLGLGEDSTRTFWGLKPLRRSPSSDETRERATYACAFWNSGFCIAV